MDVLGAVQYVGTGLSLIAFVVAAILLAYRARLKNRAEIIASAPEHDRLEAIAVTAEFFRVDTSKLTRAQQQEIVLTQIDKRSKRDLLLATFALSVAILLAIIATVAIWKHPSGLDEKQVGQVVADAQKPLEDKVERLLAEIAREKGVEIAPLRAILVKLGEAGVRDEDIPKRLDEKADELVKLRAEIARLQQGPNELASFALQAQNLIDRGDLDGARDALAEGRLAARKMREQSSRYEGDFLAQEAKVDHLQFAYRRAAAKYAEAAGLIAPFDKQKEWEFDLAQADELYSQGSQFGGASDLAEAIAIYRDCLLLAPRPQRPFDWAQTQNDLGVALWALSLFESGTARLEEAVVAYRAALEERTRERKPVQWAVTQTNLGNALWVLGMRENSAARLEEAIVAFRDALKESTRERVPIDWAVTQISLANALQTLGTRESGTGRLEEAVVAFRDVLKGTTRDRAPIQWATAQVGLGTALQTLGTRQNDTGRQEEAVVAFRDSLKEFTLERAPIQWAAAHVMLGNILQALGSRESTTTRLEEAATAFREALKGFTRENAPAQWATAQANLGDIFQALGTRENSAVRFEEAVTVYRAALEERTRERDPLQWATTQASLGIVLSVLGRSDSGTARLEEATIAYRAALEVLTRENHAAQWAAIQGGLGLALFMLGERESGTVRFEHAVVAHRAALEEQTRERDPVQWAMTQASLGNALHMLGTRDNDTIRLEEAVIAFRDALHELTRERAPTQWAEIVTSLAQTEESLGFAYFHRGDFVAAARHLREGGDRNAYSFLWLYLASSRIGEPNTKENLQENATRLNLVEWPYPVIELFLGQRTPVDMVAAATSQDEICESQFYLGQWYLLRDERAASIEALRKVIDDTCSRDLIEFAGAATELKRLGQ